MIGVFDSGYGGLTVLKALVEKLPDRSFLYFGDNARAPYGSRSPEEILEFTRESVEFLFGRGCDLVILACNTSSSNALRRIQEEVLPRKYPTKRVLGILVPTVEKATEGASPKVVGVLGTEGTARSGAYEREIGKRDPMIRVVVQSCPLLVPMIEGEAPEANLRSMIRTYLHELLSKVQNETGKLGPEALILGCTHYTLVKEMIQEMLSEETELYDQPAIVAESLSLYLERHPEIAPTDGTTGTTFFTTGDARKVSRAASLFLGAETSFGNVRL